MKTIAIIGASGDRTKFGNKAVRAYQEAGWRVFPVNPKQEDIGGLETYASVLDIPERLDRVSIYLQPDVVLKVLDDIARKKPQELIFNPGSSNEAVLKKARELGLDPVEACSIVDIGHTPEEYN